MEIEPLARPSYAEILARLILVELARYENAGNAVSREQAYRQLEQTLYTLCAQTFSGMQRELDDQRRLLIEIVNRQPGAAGFLVSNAKAPQP